MNLWFSLKFPCWKLYFKFLVRTLRKKRSSFELFYFSSNLQKNFWQKWLQLFRNFRTESFILKKTALSPTRDLVESYWCKNYFLNDGHFCYLLSCLGLNHHDQLDAIWSVSPNFKFLICLRNCNFTNFHQGDSRSFHNGLNGVFYKDQLSYSWKNGWLNGFSCPGNPKRNENAFDSSCLFSLKPTFGYPLCLDLMKTLLRLRCGNHSQLYYSYSCDYLVLQTLHVLLCK